jgi:hypothetical protein
MKSRTATAPIVSARAAPPRIAALLAERSARDLVAFAQELLLLDPGFESAFPRERTIAAAPGLEATARRVLRRDAFEPTLPSGLKRDLETLVAPSARGGAPSRQRLVAIAEAALRAAIDVAPRMAAPHLVRAQKSWWFDASRDRARGGFDDARTRARTRRTAALSLLHGAIAAADAGEVDDACDTLANACRLDPESLSIAWTLGVYALATRRKRCFEQQLDVVRRCRDVASVRRRGLALPVHFEALARRGVLPPHRSREHAAEFLSRLPPYLHAGVQR